MNSRTRVVVALGVSQTLAWGSTYYLPAILAVPMARDLGLTTGTVFAAFSSALVVSAVLGPAVGRRIDGFGGRDVLTVSSLVFALGLVLLGLAAGPMMLWAGWLVIGVGMGMGLYESAFSTLAGLYGREARGPITGITLLAGFASTVCWPITGWLNAEFGWQNACFTWAAVHLLLGLPLNRLLVPFGIQPPAPRAEASAAEGETTWLPMALLAFVFAVTWFVSTSMAAHLPWLLQIAGLSPAGAIAAAALVGPAQVAARLLEFSLLQRFHPLLSAKLAVVAHPLGALGVITLGAPFATLFVLLHGAGNGILTIAKGTLPLAIFGPHGYGLRQGVLMVPARFGQALAPLAFALLIERFGTQALLFSSSLGLAALVALFVLQTHAMKEAT
ncbi:MFS transporter [Halomonas chromatireducens]|uniref:Major Facilitator Superfamily protein n=1 Tax=Halomonas chromatireducens TaxID=507626 RepID=A0A0X8HDC7_9GAMM|nr:MFS transporter [Halomonas chromatireducens]AMD00573.1 Major Facilitator Superfamily protein [Halomonas chromatireducens]